MEPVHSRPRRIRSDRGLSQWGGLFPFWNSCDDNVEAG